jgi:diguanylate cyclase (GGDEF)-like protein
VFRIGGDEFAVILRNEDYRNREELAQRFVREEAEITASKKNSWEQVHVTMGTALYDPASDTAVIDVVRRADKDMYENKRRKKNSEI